MDLAEGLPAISAAPGTPKRRSWPRAALAFCAGRQWVITRPGLCGQVAGALPLPAYPAMKALTMFG
eukprot:5523604-Prymnesium_polylepis.1